MNIQVLVCFCVYLWCVFENVCGVSLSMLVHVVVFFDVSLSVCVCVCVLDTLRDTTHTHSETHQIQMLILRHLRVHTLYTQRHAYTYFETCLKVFKCVSDYTCMSQY